MVSQPIRLLVVEDDLDTASLIQETLRHHFGPNCVEHCSSLEEIKGIELARVDMVLSDMNLPDATGLDVLSLVLLRRPEMPVILVTGEGIIENAARAIHQGEYDYIVKAGDYLFAIPLMVEKNLAIHQTRLDNRQLQERLTQTLEDLRVKNDQLEDAVRQLQTMAATDPLTGLANRRSFGLSMGRCFAEAVRYGNDLACIMIDLDGFKKLNDTLGHQRGDDLLQHAARTLQSNCRTSDIAGRFGGDEFVVLLPQTDDTTAQQVAARISADFAHAVGDVLKGTELEGRVTMSMGLACLRSIKVTNPDQMLACADHALYRAKQTGRAKLVAYSAATAEAAKV